jgi:hypothetical protein
MNILQIQNKIYELRGKRVMFDFDLAVMYGTETKRLKEAVRRNIQRFPEDFMFEVHSEEIEHLRTHFATSKRGGRRYMPFAFTEQGVAMLSSVLNTDVAIAVNILIIRAFVFVREMALTHRELSEKLKKMEGDYNKRFGDIYDAINYLLEKDKHENRRRVGFRQHGT